MEILKKLFELQDKEYANFQSKLTPNIPKEQFIGVRVPEVRKLAKQYIKENELKEFFNSLPHNYYDENMLHGLLISEIKDYDECIKEVDKFLPYVDNWAVCDIMSPKIFKKHKQELLPKIKEWSLSSKIYTCRFGIEMLMSHFLDEDFQPEYLKIPAKVHLEEYYVQMMIAWFYATSLAKQWDDTIIYLTENKLDTWIHNKTIQKACESYRITDEQKKHLKSLKK
jgi:3-methyladenine DNA glycosylase AlkD